MFFLEGCKDLVYSLNDDGLMLLYFIMRVFNNCFLCVEFECCVWGVILILCGVFIDFKLDEGVKVIDEC